MDIKKISEVITIIKKNKYKAFLVGGASRDFLLSRNFDDVDIATNAPISFLKKTFKVENVEGESMGSIKISYKNQIIEITKFRLEKYLEKSTYPKIEKFVDDPSEDAIRRDFTINAIYLDCSTNQIIDPYDGLKDLFTFKIKFIGEPKERIKQDPTRILRGLRLAYKLNFEIEENTNNAFKECFEEIKRLSKTRLNKEIEKMELELGKEKTESILKLYNIDKGE